MYGMIDFNSTEQLEEWLGCCLQDVGDERRRASDCPEAFGSARGGLSSALSSGLCGTMFHSENDRAPWQPENKTVFMRALQSNEEGGSPTAFPHLSSGIKCQVLNFFLKCRVSTMTLYLLCNSVG